MLRCLMLGWQDGRRDDRCFGPFLQIVCTVPFEAATVDINVSA